MLKTLICPALPLRCSDRTEYSGLVEESGQNNITLILSSRLYWQGVGHRKLELDFSSTEETPYFPRGIYQVEDHCLKLRDWCGFFEYRLRGEKNSQLTVYPASQYLERGVPARRNHVPEKRAFISWQKDREFFDTRPYYPGDDPRRINWKMLARHDELFIKEGNSLSPSKKSALLMLDGSGSMDDTDRLFRKLSALTQQLAEAGLLLTALLPGKDKIQGLETFTALEKDDLFASVHPVSLTIFNKVEEERFGIVYFFSGMMPDETVLRSLDASFRDSRKILVLCSSEKTGRKGKLRGWNIVKA
ncbi:MULTISPECIES: DUF58 domain-containing protein [unclassified Oceanispirochaeta]|uniref:DUF58 domain-containing protein n=1 Tax=unclassified Oceanispirochaeta TaxID=2635722 RepID=UPI000E08D116|nr:MULTISPECIES: DUF58 domain-containing protein [unclassified Oceanispirochaeta]MBF9015396.1 DUF58 domain-containing protein [Oceanispirochaeta sp. M2]NPD71855.1 DUF58 domain-containing protein [Oceanispirochaeta sp. M1]RDG32664.1 DUF58 domain-containing protein [Oceanispirochaeta sp. M1]